MKTFILKTLVKIIERFEYANGNWRLTYHFFQLPLKVCYNNYRKQKRRIKKNELFWKNFC